MHNRNALLKARHQWNVNSVPDFVFIPNAQETSCEAFKEKRFLDQLKVILNDVTVERNAVSEQLKHYRTQVST